MCKVPRGRNAPEFLPWPALDTPAKCSKLRPVRTRPVTAVLMAWLLIGSGICFCLSAAPAQLAPRSHDCGNGPTEPASEDGAACEAGCAVADAVTPPAGDQAADQATPSVGAVCSEDVIGPACLQASRDLVAGLLQSTPAYILHSVLLI